MNINPGPYSPIIWKSLVLRDRLGALGDPSEPFGTAAWLENIVLKALGYPLAFLGKGTWLKSVVLKERLTIHDYLLHPYSCSLCLRSYNIGLVLDSIR
jgi:hypothetical protein